jgi:hypothetical protein
MVVLEEKAPRVFDYNFYVLLYLFCVLFSVYRRLSFHTGRRIASLNVITPLYFLTVLVFLAKKIPFKESGF